MHGWRWADALKDQLSLYSQDIKLISGEAGDNFTVQTNMSDNFIHNAALQRFASQVCCCPSWQPCTAMSHQYFLHVSLLGLVERRCDSLVMNGGDRFGDVIISQGLTCQQTFTVQVSTHEYGSLITLSDSTVHIPNIVSLNTVILKAQSSFTSLPLPCWMRWHPHYTTVSNFTGLWLLTDLQNMRRQIQTYSI